MYTHKYTICKKGMFPFGVHSVYSKFLEWLIIANNYDSLCLWICTTHVELKFDQST